MKSLIVIVLLLAGIVVQGQSTTYSNNFGTNYVNGKTGNFTKSSFTWTITQTGNNFVIKTNAISDSFTVTYSHFDNANKLYVYKPVGQADFDGSRVTLVLTNGKMSEFAKGSTAPLNLMAILFADNSGYMYKLNK